MNSPTMRRLSMPLVLAALSMAGCGNEVRSVTSYEAGVYKGAEDPLLDFHATAEHKALLQERFTKVQKDR